jgi:putative ABC transport system substrate-binding protein
MKRREFISLVGGAATYPFVAQAQQAGRMRRLGVLMGVANDGVGQARVDAFRESLRKHGWVDSRNIQFDYRWEANSVARAHALAAELIRLSPDVILAAGTPALAALHQDTKTIPVVFAQASDPVGGGFVASIAHPGSNITGFTDFEYTFAVKWLETLKEIAPQVARAIVMYDATSILPAKFLPHILAAGPSFGVDVSGAAVGNAEEIGRAIDKFANGSDRGLIVLPGSIPLRHRELIFALAMRAQMPAVYPYRVYAVSGGLTSYGVDILEMYRGAASYVDRILKGESPANLPIQFVTKFEYVVNLKTAKAMGLVIPTSALLHASEVIE